MLSLWLIIHASVISAQEESVTPPVPQEVATPENPLRTAELALTFDETAPVPGAPAGPSVWAVIRMILVLILVAAAIYGIVFLFRKTSRQQRQTSDPYLKVLANTHLGANRYAHIISAGSRAWLIGSSEGGVNLISEIEDKEIIDAMMLDDSGKAEQVTGRFPDFISLLRSVGFRANSNAPGADDIRKRRERLKGL